MDDQAEMVDTARRINDDEVILVRSSNFLELRYELTQVSAIAQRITVDEVIFVRSSNFLQPRYEPRQGIAMHLCRNRIMIRQLQFLLVLPNPFTPIPRGIG